MNDIPEIHGAILLAAHAAMLVAMVTASGGYAWSAWRAMLRIGADL